jgi:hypothetical protein
MAEMIPDRFPLGGSVGEEKVFGVLKRLPSECIVYYEPSDKGSDSIFILIWPEVGLLAIQHLGWSANDIANERGGRITLRTEGETLHPVARLELFLESLAERCLVEPGFEVLLKPTEAGGRRFRFSTASLAVMSRITRDELRSHSSGDLSSVFPESQVITRDVVEEWLDDASNTDEITADLKACVRAALSEGTLTDGQTRMLRALIHPEVKLVDLPDTTNVDIAVLDLRQEKHARALGSGHRLIYGVAGSGKTVLLIARARHLARKHPEQRILFVCYNVTLAAFLRKRLQGLRNVEVHHFDGWARRLISPRERGEEDEDFGRRLLSWLQQQESVVRVYDTILIDEAQDFDPTWFQCMRAAMKDQLDGDLVIVSDASQGLYRQSGVSWRSLGIRARGRTINAGFDLDKNYRNTREIVELARHFASPSTSDEDDGMLCLAVDPGKARRSLGIRPVLFNATTRSLECSRACALVEGLLKGRWLDQDLPSPLVGKDIGVLYPMIPGQSENQFRCFLDDLRKLDKKLVWLTSSEGEDLRTRVNEPGIKVQTIHSAKGLEYRAVIIIWADMLPRTFHGHTESEERRVMYVAMTRARDFLAITYSRGGVCFHKSYSAISGSYVAFGVGDGPHAGERPGSRRTGLWLADRSRSPRTSPAGCGSGSWGCQAAR